MKKKKIILVVIIFILFSCSSLTNNLIDGLSKSLYRQKDIKLIEDGAPAFLLLIEGIITTYPDNKDMLMAGIQTFSAYSQAFVNDKVRQKIFQNKTKEWAIQLLRTYPLYRAYEKTIDKEKREIAFKRFLNSLGKRDVKYVFWAANAWIMWIIGNLDDMMALLELAEVKEIIGRIKDIDGSFYYGAPHLFYGVYYSAFPEDFGGNLKKAKEEFDIALSLSKEDFLTTRFFYAIFYLKTVKDRDNFVKILEEIIAVDIDKYPDTRLLNLVIQNQAKNILENIDNFIRE
ncbi:MAG TPA: TRAP transporter TatT component family protein [Spirochaetota bacterium]|nr:TRAP transporter TatT component family protein [Spirochaetota bacterium]HOL57218.1 TRAP transporter TatT component family protein [Spirochaetota bacterium]HPP04853.1 TRAP transporter TatT component family protein [Spirochaetota bacterium]